MGASTLVILQAATYLELLVYVPFFVAVYQPCPGAIAFVLILDFAYSIAANLVRPNTAWLLEYWDIVGLDKETRVRKLKELRDLGIKF